MASPARRSRRRSHAVAPVEDAPRKPASRLSRLPLGWTSVALIVVALVLSGGLKLSRRVDSASAMPHATPASTHPAWGTIARAPFRLLPPPERLVVCDGSPPVWRTNDRMRERITAAMGRMGLDAQQTTALRDAMTCPGGGDCTHNVDPALVLGLSRSARTLLYPILAQHPANLQALAFHFRSTSESELREEMPEISAATLSALWRLTYDADGRVAFADAAALCNTLPESERLLLLRSLNGMPSLTLSLKLDASSDVDELVRYYRRLDLAPRLKSLAAAGGTIDVRELLPERARERLFSYPRADSPAVRNENCTWTALNFLRDQPDSRLSDLKAAHAELRASYREVPHAQATFGDVVAFLDRRGNRLEHTATYIADDVTFTRNGASTIRPWTMMALSDLNARYAGYEVHYFHPQSDSTH